MERFLEGLTDCCRVDSNTLGQLSGGKTSLLTFRNGTVSLLLNQASPQLAQEAMRQALCYSFPLAQYAQGGDLPDSYEYAGSIIPGAARLYDESYTDLTAKGFSLGSVTYPDGSSTSVGGHAICQCLPGFDLVPFVYDGMLVDAGALVGPEELNQVISIIFAVIRADDNLFPVDRGNHA